MQAESVSDFAMVRAEMEHNVALLEQKAAVMLRLPHPGAAYVVWLREVFSGMRLETQALLVPRILPRRGTTPFSYLKSIFELYFTKGLKRWLNESYDSGVSTPDQIWTQWMADSTPVIQALLRTSTNWPAQSQAIVQELLRIFTHIGHYSQRSYIWLFRTAVLTAREDHGYINWRYLFRLTGRDDDEETAALLAELLHLPDDPSTALPPAEVLIQQANELLARLPGSEQEYLQWWRDVTNFIPLETQGVLLPQLLPKTGQWRLDVIVALMEPYFSNAVSRWMKTRPEWVESARPIVEALLQAPAIELNAPRERHSDMAMSLLRAFNNSQENLEVVTMDLANAYAMLFDVAAKLAKRENRWVNWELVVARELPTSFIKARERGETFPALDVVLDPLLYTPELAWLLRRRRIKLVPHLAVVPEVPPAEEAQRLLSALTVSSDHNERERLAEAYKQILRDVFQLAKIETQNAVLQYLPTPEHLAAKEAVKVRLYTTMVGGLVFDESRPVQSAEENVAALIQHGDSLLRYMLLKSGRLSTDLRDLVRNLMRFFTVLIHREKFKGRRVSLSVFDPIIRWVFTTAEQLAVESNLPTLDFAAIRKDELSFTMPGQGTVLAYLPLTNAFLAPRIAAQEAAERAHITDVAATGLRQRLVARRRLSSAVPYFFEPSAPAQEAKEELKGLEEEVPLFAAPPLRRSSTRVTAVPADLPPSAIGAFLAQQSQQSQQQWGTRQRLITPASSSVDIRSWLGQQQAQEAAFAATLPLIPATTRARWQQGRRTSLAAVLAAEPLRPGESAEEEEKRLYQARKTAGVTILNCEKYAHETCSESHNQSGVHWCKIPSQFRWGPILPNKQCYDVREIFQEFARQVTDIPSVPYKARPLTYPDRVPVRPNHLQTLLIIAQENRLPIPPEVHLYLAGRELQRAPPKYMASVPKTAQRLRERAPYAVVPLFLEAQEEAISQELQGSIYSGPPTGPPARPSARPSVHSPAGPSAREMVFETDSDEEEDE